MLYLLFLVLGLLDAADTHSTHLSGRVVDSAGQPVSQAKLSIFAAYPRAGGVILSPAGCAAYQERASTDATGKFEIRSLSPELLFQLTARFPCRQSSWRAIAPSRTSGI
jgi:protocatechuate 3,4-dioxygenase beta subunit